MKIAFLENFLNVRGTTVALYDYAVYNETLLGNQSIVITKPFFRVERFEDASFDVYQKFQARFPVFFYETRDDIDQIIGRERPDVLYVIKAGTRDDELHGFAGVKTLVHCVFHPHDPHGNQYAVISHWLNAANKRNFPVLPHIVHLPDTLDDLRAELHIPLNSVVFGRHGGYDGFDHPDAQGAVRRIVAEGHSIYFVFLNTQPFLPYSPNVIFLPKTTCPLYKTKFINTCDAMIYGRSRGETFGLAIGEFSSRNKPIFAALQAPDRMHQVILQHKAFWFLDEDDLFRKMVTFRPVPHEDWNRYREFSPETVMATFGKLLQETLRSTTCYVTLCWDTPCGRLLDVSPEDEVIVFVHERFESTVPKVVASNVFIKVIDEEFLERFKIRKRKAREAEAMNTPAYRELVGARTLPADLNVSHCHVELLGWAAERMSKATHFAWIDPLVINNVTGAPSWYTTAADPHRVNYFLEAPLDPSTDGRVMQNLQRGVSKVHSSFFGGSREAMLTYRQVYQDMHHRLLEQGIVDDDRHMALLCMVETASLFHVHGPQ